MEFRGVHGVRFFPVWLVAISALPVVHKIVSFYFFIVIIKKHICLHSNDGNLTVFTNDQFTNDYNWLNGGKRGIKKTKNPHYYAILEQPLKCPHGNSFHFHRPASHCNRWGVIKHCNLVKIALTYVFYKIKPKYPFFKSYSKFYIVFMFSVHTSRSSRSKKLRLNTCSFIFWNLNT